MAQLSKRKRDERRFGTPERLADLYFSENSAIINGFSKNATDREWEARMDRATRAAIGTEIIEASNVAALGYSMIREGVAGFREQIKAAIPPFPECFVEFRIPTEETPQIKQVGWAVFTFEKGTEPPVVYDALMQHPAPGVYEKAKWIVVGTMSIRLETAPGTGVHGILRSVSESISFLDEHGESLQPPYIQVSREYMRIGQGDWLTYWTHQTWYFALLAFTFMNMETTVLHEIAPSAKVNRERIKTGRKPFVRYHVIDATTALEVLRTEGGLKENGLAKALHICRGHLVVYRDTFMGRKLDKPLVFWRKAHLRGNAKVGVVVSDYSVSPPKPKGSGE